MVFPVLIIFIFIHAFSLEGHPPKDVPLDVDFTVLSGKQDEDTPEEVEAWKIHTTGNCDVHYFEGDHFFIHDEVEKVMDVINNAVRKAME